MGKKSKSRENNARKRPRQRTFDENARGGFVPDDGPQPGAGTKYELERLDAVRWKVPRQGAMNTHGIIYSSDELIDDIRNDPSVDQVANVAHLPGIVGPALAMPDIHWGYGFPIGGVAAFDMADGVISPGGVGYDINCGVRLLSTPFDLLAMRDDKGRFERLMTELYKAIPSGVGASRGDVRLDRRDLDRILRDGAPWVVDQGWGNEHDAARLEAGGVLEGADPAAVTDRARERGAVQLGTLGSGNHFCELGWVDEIYDPVAAEAYGLRVGGVTVFVHCGSRGLGYQVCDDNLRAMIRASIKYGIDLPDRQLCCAPLSSPEGRAYLAAMNAAANFAFANRQLITDRVRRAFDKVFGRADGEIEIVYDVCHNIAKVERHLVDGVERTVCVHRKGATRAFPPGHAEIPERYRAVGQPVLVPGDMGRYSYVLAGTEGAFLETFGSCCHGAGRKLSRTKARKAARGRRLVDELAAEGIAIRAASQRTIDEEMPQAYKDVAEVVDVVDRGGIGRKVARIRPLGVVKG